MQSSVGIVATWFCFSMVSTLNVLSRSHHLSGEISQEV